jgi:phosphoadenosine phosphosulfate reductase
MEPTMNLNAINQEFAGQSPQAIIAYALALPLNAVVTTHFGPLEAVILHMASQIKPDIQVVWVDSGYNTKATYRCAEKIIQSLKLKVDVFTPKISAARQEAALGGIPLYTDASHRDFTETFKLEPFRRAMAQHKPQVWLTALRKEQTEFRQSLNIFTQDDKGTLKVAPFFYWTEAQMRAYLDTHQLPNEDSYYDPTKALENRECGLHTSL